MADSSFVQPRPGMDGNNGIFDVDVEEIDDLNEIDNIVIGCDDEDQDQKMYGNMI